MPEVSSFDVANRQLAECADILRLDPDVHAVLRSPMREVHVSLPIRMDDGTLKVFQGCRVQYNDARGPTKGGIRFHPDRTVDAIRAQSAWMTWKCALLDLPLGGAGGGIMCNPKEMSRNELERLSRAYVDALFEYLGPEKDIPAPDIYTDPQVMAWMMDEYFKLSRQSQFGVITGKPLAVGGSVGRADAAARGGMFVLREAAQTRGIELSRSRVAIQGFGNAGYFAALLCGSLFGAKVVAVSDSKGGVFNRDGLDPEAVRKYKGMTGSVIGMPKTEAISNEDLLELDVDILIPAAIENVITETNAPRIKAKILAELANGPTTPEADVLLHRKGIHHLPDVLCNAGGVTVSYFEMVQNSYMFHWDKEMIYDRLDKKQTASYHAVQDASQRFNITMRKAAYVVAVTRVVDSMRIRGRI